MAPNTSVSTASSSSTPAPTPVATDATAFAEQIAKDPENTLLTLPLAFNKTELGMFEDFVTENYSDIHGRWSIYPQSVVASLCGMIRVVEIWMDLEAFVDSHADSRTMSELLCLSERSYVFPYPSDDDKNTLRFASEAAQAWLEDLKAGETESKRPRLSSDS
jgi:hypothetical protein